jgi:hypothetical protein
MKFILFYNHSVLSRSQISYSFVEVFVEFIERRPTSVLELVFKDGSGVKRKSNKFKEGDRIHWNLEMFVLFAVSLSS